MPWLGICLLENANMWSIYRKKAKVYKNPLLFYRLTNSFIKIRNLFVKTNCNEISSKSNREVDKNKIVRPTYMRKMR